MEEEEEEEEEEDWTLLLHIKLCPLAVKDCTPNLTVHYLAHKCQRSYPYPLESNLNFYIQFVQNTN